MRKIALCLFIFNANTPAMQPPVVAQFYYFYANCSNYPEKKIIRKIKKDYKDIPENCGPFFVTSELLNVRGKLRVQIHDTPENIISKFKNEKWFTPEILAPTHVRLQNQQ